MYQYNLIFASFYDFLGLSLDCVHPMPKRTAFVVGLQDSSTPQKKTSLQWFNGRTCACQSPQVCVPLVKQFAELGDAQGGFWAVTGKVKPLHERPIQHRTAKIEFTIQQI
jgi:hypothetical protein